MQSPNHLVSIAPSIGEKRETNGNESGNGRETKAGALCRSGNEMETKHGNEGRHSVVLVSIRGVPPTPPGIRSLLGIQRKEVEPTSIFSERDSAIAFP